MLGWLTTLALQPSSAGVRHRSVIDLFASARREREIGRIHKQHEVLHFAAAHGALFATHGPETSAEAF